jgi:hypothetical protein
MHKKTYRQSWFLSPFPWKIYISLPFQCHLCPIWPLILPQSLTYSLIVLSQLSLVNLPCTDFSRSICWISHVHFPVLRFLSKESIQVKGLITFHDKPMFYAEGSCTQPPSWRIPPTLVTLFSTFSATLHSWRLSTLSTTWEWTRLWRRGTHLT